MCEEEVLYDVGCYVNISIGACLSTWYIADKPMDKVSCILLLGMDDIGTEIILEDMILISY